MGLEEEEMGSNYVHVKICFNPIEFEDFQSFQNIFMSMLFKFKSIWTKLDFTILGLKKIWDQKFWWKTLFSSMMFVLMENLKIARNEKNHHENPICDII